MGLRRPAKRAAHRLLGDWGYAALQSRYWSSRVRQLRYPYEFRDEIEAVVSPGDTVLDVGANVGQYAALLAGMVGRDGRVVAFEPVPRTYRILSSVASRLHLANVEPVQLALTDTDGVAAVTEVLDRDGLPDSGLAHLAGETGRGTVEVPVARLDSLCDGTLAIDTCSFMKIDVEGAELLVLRGASTFLRTRRPTILVEIDRGMHARYGCTPEQTFAFLEEHGYDTASSLRRGENFLFRPIAP